MKAIIFDFDGVIHDTFEVFYDIMKQLYPNITKEEYRSYFDGNIFKKVDIEPSKEEDFKFKELVYEAFKKLKLEKNIRTELEKLSKKFDLYIISSNSIDNLKMYFKNNNFTNVFEEILAAEAHKSKVKKIKILFEKYDLNPNSCIFVTDTLGDILEGNKVGIKSIACTFGFHDEERLKKGNPFKIISNFEEIRKIINNISN